MAIPTLRAKNQVTLPAAIVTRAGLRVGEPLAFEVKDGAIYIKAYSPRSDNEDWLTDEVVAEIEQASQERLGPGYDSAEEMIAALHRG